MYMRFHIIKKENYQLYTDTSTFKKEFENRSEVSIILLN